MRSRRRAEQKKKHKVTEEDEVHRSRIRNRDIIVMNKKEIRLSEEERETTNNWVTPRRKGFTIPKRIFKEKRPKNLENKKQK